MNGWIDIEDRMPKEGELVQIRSFVETEAYYQSQCKLSKWIQPDDTGAKGAVTHWRPITENIKKEESHGR